MVLSNSAEKRVYFSPISKFECWQEIENRLKMWVGVSFEIRLSLGKYVVKLDSNFLI